MRGKDMTEAESVGRKRITPAYAGKRPAEPAFHCIPRDHPRLCGEKTSGNNVPEWGWGITPAYAGKRF